MTVHPLDPLSADEIRSVAAILRREREVARPGWRIASIELREPAKELVRAFTPGDPVERQARVVAWRTDEGTAFVGVVDLTGDKLVSWEARPGRHPNATVDEWHECDEAMRRHPEVIAKLAERGITDPELILIDVWTYGAHLVPQAYTGRRVGWCDLWVRGAPDANPYAHPISGLSLVVDLNTMELLEIEDVPSAGTPEVQGEYVPGHVPGLRLRDDLKRLDVVQPEGASFTLDGYELSWQGWCMRVGFGDREGLILHTVSYGGRSIAYRMSFAEMVVPYRDPTPDHARRTAYDIGEWGLGFMTTSLELGCDCLGEITYLDAVVHDTAGEPQTIRNAVCIHEEDDAVLWKHVDQRTGAEVRRSRRLVISCHATVANYEYLVYWRFYQDGNIECEVRATGIIVTTPFAGDEPPPYGTVVDIQTYAPIHQHFITARLDMDVDGTDNTVVMTETVQLPTGPDNPHGLALAQRSVPLHTESEGKQDVDWSTQRAWKVVNPHRRNKVGTAVAYKLVPGGAIPPMLDRASPVFRRAQLLEHTLWVTPFSPEERWPSGEFVNQSVEDEGLPVWTEGDRPINDTDVVLWYTFGIHHVPRVEEWPIMSVDVVSFWLKPAGFFDHNPALDVPPPCHEA